METVSMIEIVVELMIWTWMEFKTLLYLFNQLLFDFYFDPVLLASTAKRSTSWSSKSFSQNTTPTRIPPPPKQGTLKPITISRMPGIIIPWGQNSYCGSIIATPRITLDNHLLHQTTLNALVLPWSRMVRVPGREDYSGTEGRVRYGWAPKNRPCTEE